MPMMTELGTRPEEVGEILVKVRQTFISLKFSILLGLAIHVYIILWSDGGDNMISG